MASIPRPERRRLAPDLDVSRVVTGLWQVADMERDGRQLDLDATARRRWGPTCEAGFTTFDMADHYGSAEEIAGLFVAGGGRAELLTKWVPEPGPVGRDDGARRGGARAAAAAARAHRPAAVPRLAVLRSGVARRALLPRGAAGRGPDRPPRRCQLRHRAPARGGRQRHPRSCRTRWSFSLLDRRAAGKHDRVLPRARCAAARVRRRSPAASSPSGGSTGPPTEAELATWSEMKYRRFIEAAGGWERVAGAARARSPRWRGSTASRWPTSPAGQSSTSRRSARSSSARGSGRGRTSRTTRGSSRSSSTTRTDGRSPRRHAALQPIPGDCGDEYRRPPYLTATGDLSHHVESFPPPYQTRESPETGRSVSAGPRGSRSPATPRAVRKGVADLRLRHHRVARQPRHRRHRSRRRRRTSSSTRSRARWSRSAGGSRTWCGRGSSSGDRRTGSRWRGRTASASGTIQPANTLVEAALVSEDAPGGDRGRGRALRGIGPETPRVIRPELPSRSVAAISRLRRSGGAP